MVADRLVLLERGDVLIVRATQMSQLVTLLDSLQVLPYLFCVSSLYNITEKTLHNAHAMTQDTDSVTGH